MSPIGQPYRGAARPTIVQHGDTITLTDRGDLFTQEGQRPNRTAVQWERQVGGGGWEVIPPAGPSSKRTMWDVRLPSETPENAILHIGAENVGRKFRVLVWGGYGPSPGGNVGTPEHDHAYVEWGATDGSHADDDRPSERSYSEVLTVAPWGQPAPPPPPPSSQVTLAEARNRMLAAAASANPAPGTLTRVRLALELLKATDSVWLADGQAVPKAIAELLSPQ